MPGKQNLSVALTSFIVLALELSLIRFIPAEVKAISYFTNLLLFSSFFGLGLGCILSQSRSLRFLMPVGTFLLFFFLILSRGIVTYDTGGSVHYWLQSDDQRLIPFLQLPLGVTALLVFVLSAPPFVALGQVLAKRMDQLSRLEGYSWDILGSLLGSLLFTVTSYLGIPPWVWVCFCLVIFAFSVYPNWSERLPCLMSALAFLLFFNAAHSWTWSPYYFVQYEVSSDRVTVWVNSSFHQEAINFEPKDPNNRPLAERMKGKFSIPYEAYRRYHEGKTPDRVLVLGAGSGNDVNIALFNGAKNITAVEIDPAIISIGKRLNALNPYSKPEVTLINDDARHFLHHTSDRFDLVIFGTLDSQTLLSGQANLRLDNYVYTSECFEEVSHILNDGGMAAAYYSVFKPWLVGRIYATMAPAFQGHLRLTTLRDNYLFNMVVMGAKGVPGFDSDPTMEAAFVHQIPSTDDWPYIYLEKPTLSPVYMQVFAFISLLIIGVFFLLKKMHENTSTRLVFFLLGIGFTLMEAAAIVRLALLFGTTWIISAVVFSTALLTIFLSNIFTLKQRAPSLTVSWSLLVLSLAVNYLLQVQYLLSLNPLMRLISSAGLIGLPVFFAGVCFSRLFKEENNTGFALGINLIGAMAGGLLEYASMLVGMRSIWLVIILIYLLAFLSMRKGAVKAV